MITQQPHNPQNLTPEQVGVKDGWRLLYIGELICEGDEYFADDKWIYSYFAGTVVSSGLDTYRTKQPSPFADGWIKMSERKPTEGRPAWVWDSREKQVRLFLYPCGGPSDWHADYTHWMPANIKEPAPPVVELTQAQKDEAAFKKFITDQPHCIHAITWNAALAYARSEKGCT